MLCKYNREKLPVMSKDPYGVCRWMLGWWSGWNTRQQWRWHVRVKERTFYSLNILPDWEDVFGNLWYDMKWVRYVALLLEMPSWTSLQTMLHFSFISYYSFMALPVLLTIQRLFYLTSASMTKRYSANKGRLKLCGCVLTFLILPKVCVQVEWLTELNLRIYRCQLAC